MKNTINLHSDYDNNSNDHNDNRVSEMLTVFDWKTEKPATKILSLNYRLFKILYCLTV